MDITVEFQVQTNGSVLEVHKASCSILINYRTPPIAVTGWLGINQLKIVKIDINSMEAGAGKCCRTHYRE